MRLNMPVTNVEHELYDGEQIVSKTDLKGQITYINPAFIRISGFTEAELIGQPHNIVRHPDMPPEAYVDMWENLKQEKSWTGMVKNRCKNGDYYWVEATATPLRENNQVVGYMSVRKKPAREQIEAASAAYKLFREGKAKGLKIEQGRVVRTGLRGWLDNITIKQRLVAMVGLTGLFIIVMLLAGLFDVQEIGVAKNAAPADLKAIAFGVTAGSGAVALLLLTWLAWRLHTAVVHPLTRIAGNIARIAQGNSGENIIIERNDELADMVQSFRSLETKLGFDIAESNRLGQESLRVKIALDNVSTGVMIADNNFNIVY
ncbi:MAG: PAS domain-containing protein, partial [Betaproteobacteria bacterium]|nr:PAS domain-containing protein [Betaproteobacteria bacterium]